MRTKTPAFFLAGDSTTARQSVDGGGWGDGFLAIARQGGAVGENFGANGATTASFVYYGIWSRVLAAVQEHRETHNVIVTIQFGHNDQKPSANISPDQFVANLQRLVGEVRQAGGTPVLVSSLSRRNWGSNGRIERDLLDVVVGTKLAARQAQCHFVDLNEASMEYCACIGSDNAHSYDLIPGDVTHLNDQGSVVFGALMAQLLHWTFPDLGGYIEPDVELARAINEGVYFWPDVDAVKRLQDE
ncbi:hypothetical protein SEUCBS140593_008656 [Sporothrix eucalyptigena]|uniref:SGNH hydrolase-type esterase domain-containing protein n=1 Tax=Sporothrix eucalyptigena TaxID=1812306 RepID=A0ABP0CN90_9PEZI